jgi:predicted Zn-dependent protease
MYHLPMAGNLTSTEQVQADALYEEMVASWLGHEASHAFLNHARQRMLALQAAPMGYGMGNPLQNFTWMNSMGLDREREADEHGAVLITHSGYSLRGFVISLEFAQRLEELSGGGNTWLSNHPPARERIADIQRAAGRTYHP